MKKVSIIVPTYKGASSIGRAIDSVLSQSYTNFELIIVDDNGKNTTEQLDTEKIVNTKKDPRIKYIAHETNQKGSSARNTGLRKAKGEYICFLDDDDIMLPDRVKECVKSLEDNKYDGVYCRVLCCDEELTPTKIVSPSMEGNCFKEILLSDMFFGTGSNLFMTNKAVKKIGYFDERFLRHQDLEYMLRFYRSFQTINIPKILIIKSKNGINNIPAYKPFKKNEEIYKETFLAEYNLLTKNEQEQFDNKIKKNLTVSKLKEHSILLHLKEFLKLSNSDKLNIVISKYNIDKTILFKLLNKKRKEKNYKKSIQAALPKNIIDYLEAAKQKKKLANKINALSCNSFSIALLLMAPAIITLLSSVFNIPVATTSIVLASLILILQVATFPKDKTKFSLISLMMIGVYLIIYLATLFNASPKIPYSIMQFGFYFVIPIVIIQRTFSIEKILEYTIILSFPLLFGINRILALENVGLNQANMYNTYSLLPPIIATLAYILHYRKKGTPLLKLFCLINIFYLCKATPTAVRGFFLVIGVYVILAFLLKLQQIKNKKIYFIILASIVSASIILIANLNNIANLISQLPQNGNIGILTKTKHMLDIGDITNGRIDIWNKTLEHIAQRPILGNGFESLSTLTDGKYPYPHNFALQLILDCGIFGLLPIFLCVKAICDLLIGKKRTNEEKVFLLFIISISIPILFLSYDVWKYAPFWLLVGYMLSGKAKRRL